MSEQNTQTLGLFPLTSHILPGGRMQLRIFEPRYVRLVREALKAQSGFGLCMLNPEGCKDENTHILTTGTLVRIVDFESLSDGYLGITIEGDRIFDIQDIWTESDGLRKGTVSLRMPTAQQSGQGVNEQDSILIERLREVFEVYPEFAELYPEKQFDDPLWVYHRWLEILPLQPTTKQNLLRHDYTKDVQHFLHDLFAQNQ